MNFGSWLPYDDSFDSYSRDEISKLLKVFLYIVPLASIILALVNFSLGLTAIALVILGIPVFCLISLVALNKGMINLSMIILIIVLIFATTMSCALGNGIHETGIIVLPVIVLFSSLVMNGRGVITTTMLVLISLIFITFSEHLAWFDSKPIPAVRWVDLVVVETIIVIHIFVSYSFSKITRKNLQRAQDELKNQESYKKGIGENLAEKSDLLRLVHHRVKNNLLLINSLIDLETYGNSSVKEELSEITESIHTVARAHDPLYHTKDYKQVSIKPYLEKLLSNFAQKASLSDLSLDLEDHLIFHEKALLLGIIMQKILSAVTPSFSPVLTVKLYLESATFNLNVTTDDPQFFQSAELSLVHLLTNDLIGQLNVNENTMSIKFDK